MWVYSCLTIVLITSCALCETVENENNSTTTQSSLTSSATASVTTSKPENISCEIHNNNCKACVENTKCYYCETDNKCNHRKLDVPDECDLKRVHYLTCKVSFVVIIGLSVGAGVAVLLMIGIACCCCCCRNKKLRISKDELKWARQRDERKQVAEEKRKERAERTEQIRQKYGLVKDSNPYQKFDD